MIHASMPPSDPAIEHAIDPQGWVDRHGDYLYRYALGKLHRRDIAEDLVQETFLAAWRGRDRFAGRAQERSWLTAILKRKIIDHLRKSLRETNQQSFSKADDWIEHLFTKSGKWRKNPGSWNSAAPDSDLEREEFWAVVTGCTHKLPERLHDVFVLWYLEEKSTENLCRGLKITPTNLWVMLHRARLRMWKCLDKNWYGNADTGVNQHKKRKNK